MFSTIRNFALAGAAGLALVLSAPDQQSAQAVDDYWGSYWNWYDGTYRPYHSRYHGYYDNPYYYGGSGYSNPWFGYDRYPHGGYYGHYGYHPHESYRFGPFTVQRWHYDWH